MKPSLFHHVPRMILRPATFAFLLLLMWVSQLSAQTLTHRYSFTTDASDSVGSANGALEGNATVSGGQLVLNGATSWLLLPSGLLNGYTAITVDLWLTWQGPGGNGQPGGRETPGKSFGRRARFSLRPRSQALGRR